MTDPIAGDSAAVKSPAESIEELEKVERLPPVGEGEEEDETPG